MSEQLIYLQIEKTIRDRIASGVYPAGSQMPTEQELVKEFDVSRLTISKSLTQLVSEGLITRTRGRGSFVCDKASSLDLRNHYPQIVSFISPKVSDGNEQSQRFGILESLHEYLHEYGVNVNVEFYSNLQEEVTILKRIYENHHGNGYVMWATNEDVIRDGIQKLISADCRLVLLDSFFPGMPCNCVMTDNIDGAKSMIDHLYGLGHRRIAYLTLAPERVNMSERLAGVISAMQHYHLDILPYLGILPSGWNDIVQHTNEKEREFIRHWLKSLLNRQDSPTAIFCSNDYLAVLLREMLTEISISVPNEISLCGFDNIVSGEWMTPSLTTLNHDWRTIGHVAGEILLRQSREKEFSFMQQYRIAPSLIVRASTVQTSA